MSENIPESIPTSADPRSKRPTKKRALTPSSLQATQVSALFAKPDREIHIPSSSLSLTSKSSGAAPPEIVANVQGSSAGAGSGEFHVYKASRRREYERLRAMDEEVRAEEEEEEFRRRKEETERRDRERTERNRGKREKARLRKARKGKGGKGEEEKESEGVEGVSGKKKLVASTGARTEVGEEDGDGNNEGGEVKNAEEIGLIIEDDD